MSSDDSDGLTRDDDVQASAGSIAGSDDIDRVSTIRGRWKLGLTDGEFALTLKSLTWPIVLLILGLSALLVALLVVRMMLVEG